VREAIAAKALHAATFVIHANQQVRAHALDLSGQQRQLRAVLPVAAKQDQPAHQRMRKASAVAGVKARAGNVDD
jgi:hypothetical protein